jgi:hypothetical protein
MENICKNTIGAGALSGKLFGTIRLVCLAIMTLAMLNGIQAQTTLTYTYTGSPETFVIPSCVTNLTITARGAQGGTGGSGGPVGANGGSVRAVLTATPGQILTIFVGGMGIVPNGGYNGGGDGGVSALTTGAGGGGASDVRLAGAALTDRILVAGGGGGGGATSSYNPTGGTGGGGSACASPFGIGGGFATGCSGTAGTVGGCAGGTAPSYASGGGGGGLNSGASMSGDGSGGNGAGGSLGLGGSGGNSTNNGQNGGGGGGGGYYGGAGGASGNGGCNGGGGGGSSYADNSLLSDIAFTAGNRSGDGEVVISYVLNGAVVSATQSTPEICPGESVSLSASGVNSYTWVSGPAGQANITVSPTVTTTYTATGTNNLGCVSVFPVTVTVNPAPVIVSAIVPTLLCVGNTATITSSGASTYTWTNGPAGPVHAVSPAVTTVYTISGTSNKGCLTIATVSVLVNTNTLGITANTTICSGKSLTLSATGANTYTWNTGSLFPWSPVTPGASTTYVVSGTDVHNCVLSNSVQVTVNPKPSITASADKSMICIDESVELTAAGANSYVWSNGSTNASQTVSLPVDVLYSYTVTGTDNNSCTNTAIVTVSVSSCLGIREGALSQSPVSVYPNPTSGIFTIHSGVVTTGQILVTDISGRTVMTAELNGDKTELDLGTVSSGVYYIRIQSDVLTSPVKIIKQ